MIKLGELVMILDLHRQGLSVSAIARQVGVDRKTVRTTIAKGLEPPTYKKRPAAPSLADRFEPYLRERLAAYPALTARRLLREIEERGYSGSYSVVRDRVRAIRPARSAGYETRFETPPGEQAQVDFARFEVGSPTSRGSSTSSGCSRWCSLLAADLGALRPRPKTKGKVERPFRYICEDFFLGGAFRNLDDLNDQLRHWLDVVANPRVHATTNRVVNEAFAEEKVSLLALPTVPYNAALRLERRASHEGMVSVGGNLYSVPDTTRRRIFDVHVLADEIRIFEDGTLVATHALLEGRGAKRLDLAHRRPVSSGRRSRRDEPPVLTRAGDRVVRRSLDFYAAVGRRLAGMGGGR